eukprot:2312192-Amphidinium_carterae.1
MAGLPDDNTINGMPRPISAADDPNFADMVYHILTTGYAPARPMETDEEQDADNREADAAAQSISSGSSVASAIDGQTVVAMEGMMWDSIVSPQCAPLVMQQLRLNLREGELAKGYNNNTTRILKTFASLARAATLQRDTFIPTAAMNNLNIHLWFTWLTEAQYNDFKKDGRVPGYKDTRGDSVHKHHRLHNTPDHCVNLHIHNRWNAAADNDNYGSNKPIYLLAWKTSINHILAHSFAAANAHSAIYFRRAEDISIEFNPIYSGQDPMNFN